MKWPLSFRWTVGLFTALVWALVAGCALLWGLRVGDFHAPSMVSVAGTAMLASADTDSEALARALGASGAAQGAPAPEVAGRVALMGVITQGTHGAALMAVDGKPAKPVQVGSSVPGFSGWSLQEVEPHAVVLQAKGQQARLEMPRQSQRKSSTETMHNSELRIQKP